MFLRIIAAVLVFGLAESVMAGSIRCGGQLFEDDQVHTVSMKNVRDHCGEPDSRKGNVLVYKQPGGIPLSLHFNDVGELENVEEVQDR